MTITEAPQLILGRRCAGFMIALAGSSLAGCGPLFPTASAPATPHEQVLVVGSFHLVAEPPVAEVRTELGLITPSGEVAGVSDRFEPGQIIRVDRTTVVGMTAIVVNGVVCAPAFDVAPEQETDIVVQIGGAECGVVVIEIHPERNDAHPEIYGSLIGIAPIAARLLIVSVDQPDRIAPLILFADESGSFSVERLTPGRYRIDVTADGTLFATQEFEIFAGEAASMDFFAP